MILENIDNEVQRLADDRLETILVKLLEEISTPDRCDQRAALISYVGTKLLIHRLKKALYRSWDKIDEETYAQKLKQFTNRAEAQRRMYYESECGCGSCRCRRESQVLKYARS